MLCYNEGVSSFHLFFFSVACSPNTCNADASDHRWFLLTRDPSWAALWEMLAPADILLLLTCWPAESLPGCFGKCWPLLSCYCCWLTDRLSRYTTASKFLRLSACWASKLAYNGNSWDGLCLRHASTSQTVMQPAGYGSHGYRYYRNMHMNTDKHHDKN